MCHKTDLVVAFIALSASFLVACTVTEYDDPDKSVAPPAGQDSGTASDGNSADTETTDATINAQNNATFDAGSDTNIGSDIPDTDTTETQPDPDTMIVDMSCSEALASSAEPIKIEGYRIEGDLLKIDVEYGGGCNEHRFRTCWNGYYFLTSPILIKFFLYHNGNDDSCFALIHEELTVDLTSLHQYFSSPMSLLISFEESEQDRVEYSF